MALSSRNQKLWSLFSTYWILFAAGALMLVVNNIAVLAIPQAIGDAVTLLGTITGGMDERSQVLPGLRHIGLWIMGLALVAGITRVFSRTLIFNAGRAIEFDLRNALFLKLTRLSQAFYNLWPTGEITSRVTNDISYVRLLFAIGFLHLVNTILAYTLAIQKMTALDGELMLFCLIPYPFLIVALLVLIRMLFDQTKVVQAQLSAISTKVQENLSGVAVVKTFNLQGYEAQDFDRYNQDYVKENIQLALIRGGMDVVITLIAGVGTLIVLIIGGRRVIAGQMSLSEFVEFNGYMVALAFPTTALGWVFSVWHRGQAAFDRVLEIYDHEEALPHGLGQLLRPPPAGGGGGVELRHVSFSYGEEAVLQDVSMQIPPGSSVAIVGRTGSGKTTLVGLIARLYDPTHGQIMLDGQDLRTLEPRGLRSNIGFVPQTPFLFSMTIGENIRFGLDAPQFDDSLARPLPTRSLLHPETEAKDQAQRIDEALQVAGLSRDLDLFPQRLDTLVGERGITLSGGQKQRITLARALLTDPRVLILDDSLSSVDSQTEHDILDHLDQIMAGRTTILITHRYNALTRVDRIYVMEHGRIIEQGSHQELMALGGAYATMYSNQKLRESLEEADLSASDALGDGGEA